jgi:hypothetical protein
LREGGEAFDEEGSMKIFAELRALVMLRRIARALEAQNALLQERMSLDYPGWARTHKTAPKPSKLADFSVPTVEEWNQAYDERGRQG